MPEFQTLFLSLVIRALDLLLLNLIGLKHPNVYEWHRDALRFAQMLDDMWKKQP